MRKLLIGTTNPSKAQMFRRLLRGCGVEALTPQDMGIGEEPEENGRTPEENARLKAEFYSRWCDAVVCNDSGLYLDALPLDDERQPGLHIRRPQGRRLNDDEMLAHYTALARSLGGRVLCYYLNGTAVYNRGRVHSVMESRAEALGGAFYMVDRPCAQRHPGWPLDSLSVDCRTGAYFAEGPVGPPDDSARENDAIRPFLLRALGLAEGGGEQPENEGGICP